jgi:ADP-heptose:LPS heptosyltransferase
MRERFGVEIIHDPTIDQLKDMDGFAAQVAAMDAVFTTSCTTAHVAGALGVPGIVVVPVGRGLHWYWFADRTDSPWYPSLRLARQRTPERWDDAIAEAVHALASLDGDARDVAS